MFKKIISILWDKKERELKRQLSKIKLKNKIKEEENKFKKVNDEVEELTSERKKLRLEYENSLITLKLKKVKEEIEGGKKKVHVGSVSSSIPFLGKK